VNLDAPELEFDSAPLSVQESTYLSKVHFLFLMLGLSQLFVTLRGRLSGVITRESFTKYKL
jgi:signal-transduction protein with cAMP-binding, CBS, and nucleotidyltransferase domain